MNYLKEKKPSFFSSYFSTNIEISLKLAKIIFYAKMKNSEKSIFLFKLYPNLIK